MANKAKQKGDRWEYEFAEYLTKVFGRNFNRSTSGSGAQFGGGNFSIKLKGRDTSQILAGLGDIVPPTGYFVVSECKNYADFPFHRMLLGKASTTLLHDWIEEVRHDARLEKGIQDVHLPHWLAFKITRRGAYICLPFKYFSSCFDLEDYQGFVYRHEAKDGTLLERYMVAPLEFIESKKSEIEKVISDPRFFADDITQLTI